MAKKRESDIKFLPPLDRPAGHMIPVVIGSYSRKLPMVPGYDLGQVHEWIVLVRSATDPYIDLSPWIASVEFTLHSSFVEPIRKVVAPPFLIKEEGWGEFPVGIKISFKIPGLTDVKTTHALKLISNDPVTVNERYDELCFSGDLDWPDGDDLPPLPVITEPLLEGRMYSLQEVPGVVHAVTSELQYDALVLAKNVAVLEEQLRELEGRYLNMKLAKFVEE